MISHKKISFLAFVTLVVVATNIASAHAEAPIKEIFSNHIGWEVNKTSKANTCSNNCQLAVASSEPGGFLYPEGVAGAANGNVYVADQANLRIQELSVTGQFLAMFGKEVNKDGKDICIAGEVANCKTGVEGAGAGSFLVPHSIAVEPAGTEEDVYVQDLGTAAIDKYTPDGTFIYRIGKEVNETKRNAIAAKGGTPTQAEIEEENICTAASHDVCKEGVRRESESTEHSAFAFGSGRDMLTVAGPEHILYVGDGSRVQELKPDGVWSDEIQMPSTVTSFAIDEKSGTLYAVYNEEPTVHEFNLATKLELGATIVVAGAILVRGAAIDSSGDLAVSVYAEGAEGKTVLFGNLYKANDGHLMSQIRVPGAPEDFTALGFDSEGALYAVAGQEILSYFGLAVVEVETKGYTCSAGPEEDSSDTFFCSLNGTVNPYKIPKTEAAFEWGRTCAFGSTTTSSLFADVEQILPLSESVEDLRPDEKTLCFRAIGYDENAGPPEVLTGEPIAFTTEAVLPRIINSTSSFPTSSSIVLFAEVNPENAPTTYHFELAAEPGAEKELNACHDATAETCGGVIVTRAAESEAYGKIGATLEANNLQPATTYIYRFNAHNSEEAHKELRALSAVGTFTTASSPIVEAFTGTASAITGISAYIEGAINPDGAPATYTLELGTYEGAGTQYDIVSSGSTGSGRTAEPVSFALSDLQPGVTYSYRVAIHSGYGTAVGAPRTLTTIPLPTILQTLTSPPLLSLPPISFPVPAPTCKAGFKLNAHNACTKVKTKTKQKAQKSKVRSGKKRKK